MTRRFPVDPIDAEQAAEQADLEAPRTRKRPADKRWKRPVSDKSSAPTSGRFPLGDSPDGNH